VIRVVGIALGVTLTLAVAHAHDPITTRVTWNGDVARIVAARCVRCHSPEGPGPMSLVTYEAARPWAKAIREEVMTRRMPKWHAVRGYGDFSNDPSLSPFEISLLVAWAEGGAPKGSDEEARPLTPLAPPAVPSIPAGVRTLTLACGEQSLPEGLLISVQPNLDREGALGIALRQPDGQRIIVAWIRGYDPDFPTVYRLRTPIRLERGSVLVTESREGCSVTIGVAALQ
jgi:hypothetical protein